MFPSKSQAAKLALQSSDQKPTARPRIPPSARKRTHLDAEPSLGSPAQAPRTALQTSNDGTLSNTQALEKGEVGVSILARPSAASQGVRTCLAYTF